MSLSADTEVSSSPADGLATVFPGGEILSSPLQGRLTWLVRILYGTGDIAHAIKTVTLGLFVLFFYTSVVGVPALWVGVASAVGVMWDALADPYIGYVSDRVDFGIGRRHSLMVLGAATMCLSLWALLSPPQGAPVALSFCWLLITLILTHSTSSLFLIPYYAMGAELSADYQERTEIAAVRGGMMLLGTMFAAGLSFVVFFPTKGHGPDPKLEFAPYTKMGLTFGVAMSVVALVAIVGTWRQRSYLAARVRTTAAPALGAFLSNSFTTFRSRPFLILFICSALFFIGSVINTSLSLYFLKYNLRITASTALSAVQFSFYLGALVGIGVWLYVSRRVEKRWLCSLGMVACGIGMAAAPVLFGSGHLLGTGSSPLLFLGYAVVGLFGSVLFVLPASMIADIMDQDELRTGQRREGLFFGIFYFGQHVAAGISLLLSGALLDRFVGLMPGSVTQSAETIGRIGLLFGAIPGLLAMVGGGLMLWYRLDRRAVRHIQDALQKTHEA